VDDFLSSRLVAGASVAVIADGELTEVVSGVADVDSQRAVTASTQFRVASVTKMYIASIVLRMVERGELSLDEPIGAKGVNVPASLAFARGLTLRQLLSHTSGLSQSYTRDEDRSRALTTADLLERIPPRVCEPGACFSYADGNYVLAQVVVEAATGESLTDVFQDELEQPLDLRDTSLVNAAAVDTALPSQYALVTDDSGRAVQPHRLFEQSLPRTSTLVTTAADAATFADALFGGDVLNPGSLTEMLDTRVMRDLPCPDGCPFEYGLGAFHFNIAGRDLIGHDGSSGTVVVRDQSDGLVVAILTNGGEQDVGAFLEAVLRAVDDTDR
jgi:CubicO group peptidase (beta-lactamase class C family)